MSSQASELYSELCDFNVQHAVQRYVFCYSNQYDSLLHGLLQLTGLVGGTQSCMYLQDASTTSTSDLILMKEVATQTEYDHVSTEEEVDSDTTIDYHQEESAESSELYKMMTRHVTVPCIRASHVWLGYTEHRTRLQGGDDAQ